MISPIVTFWGGEITKIEELSAYSIIKNGHPLIIYSYDDPSSFGGLSSYVKDACEVVQKSDYVYRYYENRRYNTFANAFRLKLLALGLGIWSDLDCIFIRPLITSSGYVFGYSDKKKINNNVLKLPEDSECLIEYLDKITSEDGDFPWLSMRRRFRRLCDLYLLKKRVPSISQKNNTGPRALTYFLKKYSLLDLSKPEIAFNPIKSDIDEIRQMYLKDSTHHYLLDHPDVICIHLWRGKLKRSKLLYKQPESGSPLDILFKKYLNL